MVSYLIAQFISSSQSSLTKRLFLFTYRYLHAQVFSKYSEYFSFFTSLQPVVYVAPLVVRLPNMLLVSVSYSVMRVMSSFPFNSLGMCISTVNILGICDAGNYSVGMSHGKLLC